MIWKSFAVPVIFDTNGRGYQVPKSLNPPSLLEFHCILLNSTNLLF